MKIKDGFIVKNVAGSNIVVPTGEQVVNFNGIMTLNETALFLWNEIQNGTPEGELVKKLLDEYDVDEATAKKDVDAFILKLKEAKFID